jgi:branched-chain amino acid transport system ATP-binding protein
LLIVKDLTTRYGLVQALHEVNVEVRRGEIVTLIGANGAGKTTLLKSIMNVVSPLGGDVAFLNHGIRGLPTEAIVKKGIILIQEGRGLLRRMTVLENLLMGGYTREDKQEIRQGLEIVFDKFPILRERQKQISGTLSGGEQQMLAIGRGLMAKPVLLMMDEPSLGLAPLIVNEIFRIIGDLNSVGQTILLVEQNARKALQAAGRAYVLELGRVSSEGPSAELLKSDEVRMAYLGGG